MKLQANRIFKPKKSVFSLNVNELKASKEYYHTKCLIFNMLFIRDTL